jgi:hypothetical protein
VNLNELFRNPKLTLSEGGNQSSHKDDGTLMPGWQGIPGRHQAQELDLNVHNRSYVVEVLSDLLYKINDLFAQQFKEPLWHENSVQAQKFLSGSTARFFDKKISDEEFVRVKPTVGDISLTSSPLTRFIIVVLPALSYIIMMIMMIMMIMIMMMMIIPNPNINSRNSFSFCLTFFNIVNNPIF